MPDATLYLFDGYNLLHAAPGSDRRELVDRLASFVALSGSRGIVVFDGVGDDVRYGPLEVRFAPDADSALERLAVEHRRREHVVLVSSDSTVIETAGREVTRLSARTFLRDLAAPELPARPAGGLASKLDAETRARLEQLRRGQ